MDHKKKKKKIRKENIWPGLWEDLQFLCSTGVLNRNGTRVRVCTFVHFEQICIFLHTVWVNDNVCIILYLEPLPDSFVMVGGSQGLAPLLHVGSGSVYLGLMESRWASYDSPLLYRLTESGPLVPAAGQSWMDHLWMGKEEHRWFLTESQEMVDVPSWQGWIGFWVWSPAWDGKTMCAESDRKHWTWFLWGLKLSWWRTGSLG